MVVACGSVWGVFERWCGASNHVRSSRGRNRAAIVTCTAFAAGAAASAAAEPWFSGCPHGVGQ
eukprot:989364-Lingulodinium_polyedra.AAC.1